MTNLFIALKLARKAFGGKEGFKRALGDFTVYGPNSNWAVNIKNLGAIGMAPPGFQTIILTDWIFADKNVIFLILHEIGHIFDFHGKRFSSPYYLSQYFVDKFGENCSFTGPLGCAANGSSVYPSSLVFYGYSPSSSKTTPYGSTSSIDDFADSFAASVAKLTDYPLRSPYDQVSRARLAIVSSLIISFR